jgi:hypothetical protein
MLRGGQNQNAKRQQVERVRAKTGFLNKAFEPRRDQSRLRTKESGQRKPEGDLNPVTPAKLNTSMWRFGLE